MPPIIDGYVVRFHRPAGNRDNSPDTCEHSGRTPAVRKEKRRHPDSNRGIEVLQTSALPLGYAADEKSGKRGSNSRQPPWQGGALPTELFPLMPTQILYRPLLLSTCFREFEASALHRLPHASGRTAPSLRQFNNVQWVIPQWLLSHLLSAQARYQGARIDNQRRCRLAFVVSPSCCAYV